MEVTEPLSPLGLASGVSPFSGGHNDISLFLLIFSFNRYPGILIKVELGQSY